MHKFPLDEWDPIFEKYPTDISYSEITYQNLLVAMELSNIILSVIHKVFDDKNVLYNSTHVVAQGHECQSVHRDMHKIPVGHRALTVIHVENYDLDVNDGTNTIILPGSRAGLPQPWDPVPTDLCCRFVFVM